MKITLGEIKCLSLDDYSYLKCENAHSQACEYICTYVYTQEYTFLQLYAYTDIHIQLQMAGRPAFRGTHTNGVILSVLR